jgi:hypothetical protein
MRIAIATPLYPPDIAEPAPYVKELATRLAVRHQVTIVTYGRLPEEIPGVRIICVNKQRPLLIRLALYTLVLLRESWKTDCIYAINGASVELPAGIVARLSGKPLFAHARDTSAHARAQASALLGSVERFFLSRADAVVSHTPLPRPEVLPFKPCPVEAQGAHEASWQEHVRILEDTFAHV